MGVAISTSLEPNGRKIVLVVKKYHSIFSTIKSKHSLSQFFFTKWPVRCKRSKEWTLRETGVEKSIVILSGRLVTVDIDTVSKTYYPAIS